MQDISSMSPQDLAHHKLELTDLMSKAGELKVRLLRNHALYYETYRGDLKSDTALERKWELTEDGLQLMELNLKLKMIEKKISAINTFLRVQENEAKNSY